MKSILFALFLLVVVVCVTAEKKKGYGRRQGGKSPFRGHKTPKLPGKGCMRNCATCDGKNCIECKEGFTKKYSIRLNRTLCIPAGGCPRNCATCDGRNCIECKEGFTKKYSIRLNRTLCIPGDGCPKNCSLCQHASCQRCDEGFELVRGRIINRMVCKKTEGNCGPRCLECSSPGDCTRCKDGFTLQNRRSKSICLMIKDPSKTKGCGKGCKTCTARKTCTSCVFGLKLLFLEQNKAACVRKCPPSTKLDRSSVPAVCTPKEMKPKHKGCGRECLSCDAPRVCTRCTNGRKLLELPGGNRVCLKKCPNFYKLDRDSQIPKCILKKQGKMGGLKKHTPE